MYTYFKRLPSVDKYNELRELAGWERLDEDAVRKSLPHSIYSLIAKCNDETIAFARIVGDGALCFHIQEIIVHPDHQRKGIAGKFMDYIISFIEKNAPKGSYVGAFAGKGLEGFYKKYGFWERPTRNMGPGMMQFWGDPDANSQFNPDS